MKKVKKLLLQRVKGALKRSCPTILTCIGAVGAVATVVLAVKATPKACTAIMEDSAKNHDGDPNAATKSEVVKSAWKYYVPAAITGVASLTCIFGANVLNRRQQASLASAYALLNHSYAEYKRAVKELYGQEAHERIVEALAVEKSNPPSLFAPGLVSTACTAFEGASEEEYLFYDSFSNRYFQATIGQVLQAEYHINRNFALRGEADYDEFCEFLGIKKIKELSNFGWWLNDEFYWIDFDNTRAMIDDGLNGEIPCYVISYQFDPMPFTAN